MWKGRRGRGLGKMGKVHSTADGHDDGQALVGWMTRPEGGSSCDLDSPELGPSRGQGQSIGLRSRDGQICTSRIEGGAECWPICGLQCGIQLHVHSRRAACLAWPVRTRPSQQHHRDQRRQARRRAIPYM